MELDFSRSGTPTNNTFVQSVNGCLRQDCFDAHWFLSPADAQSEAEERRRFITRATPQYTGIENPKEFARNYAC
ncbi:integrase core domain-containing protein [Xanthomonas campestris]|uniref:integrase core domain-containing protein n=1 Tax=Xanthomonas campestris TaxID=339 RepID=UPI0027A1E10F|nr:transposase [Xanthomonas campestris pv. campestris]